MEQTGAVPPPLPPVAWTVVPVDFTVLKKGQDMELHDATGRLAFRFAPAPEGGRAGRALLDAARGVLVTVKKSGEVSGDTSGPIIGSSFVSILDAASKHKNEYGDEFVSVEHVLRAFTSDKRFGQQLFKDLKVNENDLKDAISAVCGSQRVTDQNPEGKYQALEKNGIL